MPRKILGDMDVCPNCGAIIKRNIDVGGGFLHDVCIWCGWKRKKKVDNGRVVKEESR